MVKSYSPLIFGGVISTIGAINNLRARLINVKYSVSLSKNYKYIG